MEAHLEQRSPEWHEFRRNHIGASCAPAIMGVSPWKDVKQLYNEKTNLLEIPDSSNFAMRRGIELEPLALALFEAETGYLMLPKVLVHPIINFMSASLDGLEIENKAMVEIKCSGKVDHGKALDGEIPEKYIPQLQHQMEVTGLDKMYYMSYVSDSDFKIIEVYKDHDYIAQLLQKEAEFWECVIKRQPPESTKKDIAEIKNPEWQSLALRWRLLQSRKEETERQQEEIRNSLLEMADYSPATGFGLQLTKVIRRGNVEYSRVPIPKEIDLELYRKPSTESWRITIQ